MFIYEEILEVVLNHEMIFFRFILIALKNDLNYL